MARTFLLLAAASLMSLACTTQPAAEPEAESTSNLSAADVACTANDAQIVLSGAGAAVAVAGYVTAAAVSVEALVAAGSDSAILALGRGFAQSFGQISGVTTEAGILGHAVLARDAVTTGKYLVVVLGKVAVSGDARSILKIGYAILAAVKDQLVALDGINPIGIQKNLDILNDGLRFACQQCGRQAACATGETASRMNDFDPTKDLAVDSPAIRQGRACARGTTFWSTTSYLDQCYGCCEESGYTDDQTSGFHACRAVCNAAYK